MSARRASRVVTIVKISGVADSTVSQLAIVLAVCAVAVAVCVALISTAELKASRPVALYGLGSGEEQDADNSIVTTFEVRACTRLFPAPLQQQGNTTNIFSVPFSACQHTFWSSVV